MADMQTMMFKMMTGGGFSTAVMELEKLLTDSPTIGVEALQSELFKLADVVVSGVSGVDEPVACGDEFVGFVEPVTSCERLVDVSVEQSVEPPTVRAVVDCELSGVDCGRTVENGLFVGRGVVGGFEQSFVDDNPGEGGGLRVERYPTGLISREITVGPGLRANEYAITGFTSDPVMCSVRDADSGVVCACDQNAVDMPVGAVVRGKIGVGYCYLQALPPQMREDALQVFGRRANLEMLAIHYREKFWTGAVQCCLTEGVDGFHILPGVRRGIPLRSYVDVKVLADMVMDESGGVHAMGPNTGVLTMQVALKYVLGYDKAQRRLFGQVGAGVCYLSLFEPTVVPEVARQLGLYPTWEAVLSYPLEYYVPWLILRALKLVSLGDPSIYHVGFLRVGLSFIDVAAHGAEDWLVRARAWAAGDTGNPVGGDTACLDDQLSSHCATPIERFGAMFKPQVLGEVARSLSVVPTLSEVFSYAPHYYVECLLELRFQVLRGRVFVWLGDGGVRLSVLMHLLLPKLNTRDYPVLETVQREKLELQSLFCWGERIAVV